MNQRKKTIDLLLVEDNEGDIELLAEAFKDCNFHNKLHIATDGIEAMTYLHRKSNYAPAPRPDIIFLDLNLPKKDGREVLAEIKSDPNLKCIPTLILTTSNTPSDINTCYSLHANCFITKPTEWEEYINLIKSIGNFWFRGAQLPSDQ